METVMRKNEFNAHITEVLAAHVGFAILTLVPREAETQEESVVIVRDPILAWGLPRDEEGLVTERLAITAFACSPTMDVALAFPDRTIMDSGNLFANEADWLAWKLSSPETLNALGVRPA